MTQRPTIDELQARLRFFAVARDWEQFHTPKDLAVSVAIEAGELLEVFQWKTNEQVESSLTTEAGKEALADELADVFIYLLRLADVTSIDLALAADNKITCNEVRFPTTETRS